MTTLYPHQVIARNIKDHASAYCAFGCGISAGVMWMGYLESELWFVGAWGIVMVAIGIANVQSAKNRWSE